MQKEDSATRSSFPTYLTTNSSIHKSSRVLGDSEWAKACGSSRSYKRKLRRSTRYPQPRRSRQEKCDIFAGRWVYDTVSYPLYDEGGCPYMSDQLACTKHGRPDVEYQRMRWQPHGCNLKRFGNFYLF
ncbi:protein trichome birefringence-like 35 [Phalaenopsis equestris]|uniref:protein trichome birefringence-like 35 n=1 Tax=Phalaenopsis equestris TaxID=78828 RepID=UPI0009E2CB0E|nr:protein trichome birefringence-like 35 [Phalaenopsis equestris]